MSTNKEDGGDTLLSSHTIALRKAFQDCTVGIERLRRAFVDGNKPALFPDDGKLSISRLLLNVRSAANMHEEERENGIRDMRRRLGTASKNDLSPIDVINVSSSMSFRIEGRETAMTPYEFRQAYCARNVPCIIRGLNETDFANVSSQWNLNDTNINIEWFKNHIGGDTKVPVRINRNETSNQVDDVLDADGRAHECETVEITLSEWIQYRNQSDPSPFKIDSLGYLKDWHLQQFLSDNQKSSRTNRFPLESELYTVPSIFQHDILNSFLTQYMGGDYKFVYWGPEGSKTNLHSDVLHSFSWSYNVVGKKQWTFYIPNDVESEQVDSQSTFELIQETGEFIFVPAKWKHEVVNLVETLSINHNWITTANIDCTFECLLTEISSIEREIEEWGISNDDCEVQENMLRGCVGLDMSTFVLMVLRELIELLTALPNLIEAIDNALDKDTLKECMYSILRLQNLLRRIMNKQAEIGMVQRLTTTLKSNESASNVATYSEFCLNIIDSLEQYYNIS